MVEEVSGKRLKFEKSYFKIFFYLINFLSNDKKIKNKFLVYLILILFFGFSELIIISGFPSMISIINSLSETKTLYYGNFTANYIFFNINSIEVYLFVLCI